MKSLISFDKLIVKKPELKKDGFSTEYSIESNGSSKKCDFSHKYGENIWSDNLQRYANLTSSVPAINHGLFAREIIFDYELNNKDKEFVEAMIERMANEIFVSRFYKDPIFINKDFIASREDVKPENAISKAKFSCLDGGKFSQAYESDPNKIIVLSSGGKESLLCYGLLNEAGMEVFPVFINESGGHWKTALTAYRAYKERDPKTERVWSNADRVYSFLVRNSKVVENNIKGVKSITDPIHFFSFAHYIFAALPIAEKNKIGNICVGNEYDEPQPIIFGDNVINGVKFFPGIYDQSQEFDEYMTQYLTEAGIPIKQWAPIRSITGFQVQKTLANRYLELFEIQTSCHHTHCENGKIMPCGTCQKCLRILSFCISNGINYEKIGYNEEDVRYIEKNADKLKLGADETEHTKYMLGRKGLNVKGKKHEHVEMMHFDPLSSRIENIPKEHREKVYRILLEESKGAVKLSRDNKWRKINLESII